MLPDGDQSVREKPLVWVADDDERFLEVFRVACGSFDLVGSSFAHSSSELVKMLEATPPSFLSSVIFLDIRMEHEAAGFDALRWIRQNDRYKVCPVIIMSSSVLQEDVRHAVTLGANCYFYKPVGTRRRVEAVKKHLEYWSESVLLPELSNSSDRIGELRPPMSERARGTAWYAIDRLRQDLLVALLRDLDRLSAISLTETTKDQLEKALIRFTEIFEFRNPIFSDNITELAFDLKSVIVHWVELGYRFNSDTNALLYERKAVMDRARSIRTRISAALRKAAQEEYRGAHLRHLDYQIWDIFVELSYNPEFQYLYNSLKRFQTKAFL